MITSYHLATLNALLNASAFCCVFLGYRAIRARDFAAHKRFMLTAFGLSAVFLASYLTRIALFGNTLFPGKGLARVAYLALLASHVGLALVIAPAVIYLVVLGLRDQRERHRKIAPKVLPVWLYVLATGVLVYLVLYHFA
jgi:putative membrane protein